MPAYDMHCTACDHSYEAQAPIKDGPPKKCPVCKKDKLTQVYDQVAAFHARLSPMHPRANRGNGLTGKRTSN